MRSGNCQWNVRVGNRLYTYTGDDESLLEIRVAWEDYRGSSRLLVPLMAGIRLLEEDQAAFETARSERKEVRLKAEVGANAAGEVHQDECAPQPAPGVIAKSAVRDDDDPDFHEDEDERGRDSETLPPGLLNPVCGTEVFIQSERDRLPQTLKGFENEKRDRLKRFAEAAQRRNGVRNLDFEQAVVTEGLDALAYDFPNLSGVVDFLRCEMAIALAGDFADFRVSPVLLVGEPGIGKTAFCRALAGVLGAGFDDFSAGGGQGGFELCGTSTHFSNCTPGRVFRLLAEGESAAPVLLIDEVDKVRGDDRFPVLPTLLNLAERDSAAQFRDECLEITFDASRMIVVMTANDLTAIPAPLVSRIQVIEVPSPTIAQRRAIAVRMLAALPPVAVADEALDRLAASDVDLREVQRRLRRAVGEALARGAKKINADVILEGQWKRRAVGFVS